MFYHLTIKSDNKKLGGMATSISPSSTCPDTCPLKDKACYARFSYMGMWWKKVDAGIKGVSWKEFLKRIQALPKGSLFRHNEAGDLAGDNDRLNIKMLKSLVNAAKGKIAFTYTHKPLTLPEEREAVQAANKKGFTINISTDSLGAADHMKMLGIGPVVVTVPKFETMPQYTPAGNKLVPCPEQTHGISCNLCRLCAVANRKSIVAFAAHGSGKKYFKEE